LRRDRAGARRRTGRAALIGATGALATLAAFAIGSARSAGAVVAVPSLQLDRPCYVNGKAPAGMVLTGSGWTPGGQVSITGAGAPVTATAGLTGSFKVSLKAPGGNFRLRQVSRTLSAAEKDASTGTALPGMNAQASYLVTDLAYSVTPQDMPLSRKVTFRFSGFKADREVFGHYLSGSRVVGRERFGRTAGPCGLLKARALQFPGGHPGGLRYTVQFDDAPHYSRRASPRIVTRLSVIRY
jgi:hypothetical protein